MADWMVVRGGFSFIAGTSDGKLAGIRTIECDTIDEAKIRKIADETLDLGPTIE